MVDLRSRCGRVAQLAIGVVVLCTGLVPAVAGAEDAPRTPATSEAAATGTITGVITRQLDGSPVAGACVSAYSEGAPVSTTTNGTGQYTFPAVPAGPAYMDFGYCGRSFAQAQLVVSAGGVHTVSKALAEPSRIRGRITSAVTGKPLPGACVALESFYGTATDANGEYAIAGLPPRTYRPKLNSSTLQGCGDQEDFGFGRRAAWTTTSGDDWVVDVSSGSDNVQDATAQRPAASDLDGDGRTDRAVFRPSNGRWYVEGAAGAVAFGTAGDIPMAINTRGSTNLHYFSVQDLDSEQWVFRPSNGRWYELGQPTSIPFGAAGDVPVPGDYDGDGLGDLAVFRPTSGRWYLTSSRVFAPPSSSIAWGAAGDIPVPGDYDGSGDTEIAVFRPSNGRWYVHGSSAPVVAWGVAGDVPVPGDYDGDGDTDIAVFRPSNGRWYVHGSSAPVVAWGAVGDLAVPGDYDGDEVDDLAVFRPSNGRWYVYGQPVVAWGAAGDVPLPKRPGS